MKKSNITDVTITGEKSIISVKKELYMLLSKLKSSLIFEELTYILSKYRIILFWQTTIESVEFCAALDKALEEIRTFDKLVLKQVWNSLKYINYENISNDAIKMTYFVETYTIIEKIYDLNEKRMRSHDLKKTCYGKLYDYDVYLPSFDEKTDEHREVIEAILSLNRSTK